MKTRLRENLQKLILFPVTVNGVALGLLALAPFVGVRSPLTAVQMLWLNLVLIPLGTLALAADLPRTNSEDCELGDPSGDTTEKLSLLPLKGKAEADSPEEQRNFQAALPSMVKHFFVTGFLCLVFLVWLLHNMQRGGIGDYDLSRFFTIFVMLHLWNLFNVRCWGLADSNFSSRQNKGMFLVITSVMFLGQAGVTQWGGPLFRAVPLAAADWVKIIVATSVVLWIGELWRLSLRTALQEGKGSADSD